MLSLVTPIREYRVPLKLLRSILGLRRYKIRVSVSEYELEEFLAYLSGESQLSTFTVKDVVGRVIDSPAQIPIGTLSNRAIRVMCSDGSLPEEASVFFRHFAFFRDYIEEYPEEDRIAIPHKKDVLASILGVLVSTRTFSQAPKLLDVLDCLEFLNPLNNALFLLFSLEGVPLQRVEGLVAKMTMSERQALYLTHEGGVTVPEDGGLSVLTVAPSVAMYKEIFVPLLSSVYPSWVFYRLNDLGAVSTAQGFLLTADFTVDSYTGRHMGRSILPIIIHMLSVDRPWYEMARLLAMIDVVSPQLFNTELEVCLPYGAARDSARSDWKIKEETLNALKKSYPGEWKDEFLWEAVQRSQSLYLVVTEGSGSMWYTTGKP